jgi:FkbM family methyltransferase
VILLRRLRKKLRLLRQEAYIYLQTVGPRGLVALSSHLLCGYPREVVVQLDDVRYPFFLRIQTSDARVCHEVMLQKEYELAGSFEPRTIVDVGANCGMTSVFFANQYPAARIWALEPEPSNYSALVRNARPYPNIVPILAALWSEDGEVEIFSPWPKFTKWGKWGFHVRSGKGCRALTLRSLMSEIGIDSIDMLKVDVEGAEIEIFDSCNWIDKVKVLAIELHDRQRPGCSAAVEAVLGSRHKTQHREVSFYQIHEPDSLPRTTFGMTSHIDHSSENSKPGATQSSQCFR